MAYVITFLALVFTSIHAEHCTNKEFVKFSQKRNSPGHKLAAYKSISKSLCERTCRQYLGCKAYLMKWQDATETGQGDCELYKKVMVDPHTQSTQQSLFGYCPMSMTYNSEFGGCLRLFEQPKKWDDAAAECKKIDPEAHLVALTDEHKQNAADALAESLTDKRYFTDGKAKETRSETFVWSSSGQEMMYMNWNKDDPDNYKDVTEDCLMVWKGRQWTWFDVGCGWKTPFICEF